MIDDLLPTCKPHLESSQEDRMISSCFRRMKLTCMDTTDKFGEGRYHQDTAEFHASWTKDQPAVWRPDDLEKFHGIISKGRLGQISKSTVSFHLKNIRNSDVENGLRRYHAILRGLCG